MTPANDNQPRPAWFDALLAQYDGFIRAKCSAYDDADDLYQDVLLRVMERWSQYRGPEADNGRGNFTAWLRYHIKSVRPEQARRAKRGEKYPYYWPPSITPAAQEDYVDITLTLRGLTANEAGDVLMGAVGYSGREVGAMRGVTRAAVSLSMIGARAKLRAANDDEPVRSAPAKKSRLHA